MVILKFGGTSVGSAERIRSIFNIVNDLKNSKRAVVVVSAVSGVTDLLLKCARSDDSGIEESLNLIEKKHLELIQTLFQNQQNKKAAEEYLKVQLTAIKKAAGERLTLAQKDQIMGFGEILSSFLVALFLKEQGLESEQILATNLIVTNSEFTNAEFLLEPTTKNVKEILLPKIKSGIIPVVTGFIASDEKGRITTLGRGGSDYTASILGLALKAKEVQIWTDVDGIFTADPRVIKKARLIKEISFREASEMAIFGAKVLHPKTIRPAIQSNIPVRVLNTTNPKSAGTIITRSETSMGFKAISFKRRTVLVNIYSTEMLLSKGYLMRVFSIFTQFNISVDLVSVSEVSVSVTLDNDQNLDKAIEKLSEFSKVTVSREVGIVSLIGKGIISQDHITASLFSLIHKNKIALKMISLGASDINISLVLRAEDIEKTIQLVHDRILLRG